MKEVDVEVWHSQERRHNSCGSFLFSITERQHGCLGEPQYLSGTSARSRHRLLLCHAFAGGKLAAGMSQLPIKADAHPAFTSSNHAVLSLMGLWSHALGMQASTFPPLKHGCVVQEQNEGMKWFISLIYLTIFQEMAKWMRCTPRRVIKLSNAIWEDEDLNPIIETELVVNNTSASLRLPSC